VAFFRKIRARNAAAVGFIVPVRPLQQRTCLNNEPSGQTACKKNRSYAFIINAFALFLCKHFSHMAATKRNKGLYFLLFLISTAAFGAAIFYHWEYLTLIIPFVCTFFVLSLDII
jgi:hypothetical protein